MTGIKTYSHLAGRRRAPSEYEIVASRLLYYQGRGFEVRTPGGAWLTEHQETALATGVDWEAFDDPRSTTYHGYVERRAAAEAAVDAVLRAIVERDHDRKLEADWLAMLEAFIPTLRYPLHGLQMAAAYVAHAAPAGKVVLTGLFQAADELRRIQCLAQRMRLLIDVRPTFGHGSLAAWKGDVIWQPLRETVEHLLVTYDWLDAFAALNFAVKPALDHLVHATLPEAARRRGDHLLGELLFTLSEDAAWHREWSAALAAHVRAAAPTAADAWARTAATWRRRIDAALVPLNDLLSSARTLQ